MNLNARPPVSEMSDQQIARELEDFEWEYIALADWARTDDQYNGGVVYLDERKLSLNLEQELRARSSQLTQPAPDAWESAPFQAAANASALSTSQTLSTPTKRR